MWRGKENKSPLAKRSDSGSVKTRMRNALKPNGWNSGVSRDQEGSDVTPRTPQRSPSATRTVPTSPAFTFQPAVSLPAVQAQSSSSSGSSSSADTTALHPPTSSFTFSFSPPPSNRIPNAIDSIPLRPPAPLFPLDQIPINIEVRIPGELFPEEDINNETISLASTVYNYEYENGRRYHSYRTGKYCMPNDSIEQERLDIVHHLCLLFLNGELYTSPIKLLASQNRLRRALDCGTGTGIWAMEFGHEFPNCSVIGTDLSPIQPLHVPANVRFEVDDLEDEWLWSTPFDFIHVRTLLGSLADWPAFLRKCYANTTPGGYTELQELDPTAIFSEDGTYERLATNYQIYNRLLIEGGRRTGRRMDIAQELPRLMAEAGFRDIQVTTMVQPLGLWPRQKKHRELAYWSVETLGSGLEAYGLALFTRAMGMGSEETLKVIENAKKDLDNEAIHACSAWLFISGRRPEEDEMVDV